MIIYRNVSLVLCAVLITVYGVLNIRLNEAIISNQESVIRDIESQTMLDIPPDVEILSTDDGGGRDPSYNYYEWVLFSRSPITLPTAQQPGVTVYHRIPLETSVRLIESRLKGRKLAFPHSSLSADWVANGVQFRASLVEAKDGVYVIIMRFRKP